jgi:hypothetical protein
MVCLRLMNLQCPFSIENKLTDMVIPCFYQQGTYPDALNYCSMLLAHAPFWRLEINGLGSIDSCFELCDEEKKGWAATLLGAGIDGFVGA